MTNLSRLPALGPGHTTITSREDFLSRVPELFPTVGAALAAYERATLDALRRGQNVIVAPAKGRTPWMQPACAA